ncbi:MAG: AMP-binding protein [Acidimicrobiales bacterium]
MTEWNFADLWEVCAEVRDSGLALAHGDREVSWRSFNSSANGLAQVMLDAGVGQQDKVAQYLYNCPEYMLSVFACFKAGLVPVNTNYRYADDELLYLWDNADASVITFHASFTETIERIRSRLPKVKLWLWVDDGSGLCPDWATDVAAAAALGSDTNVSGPWGRSGKDRWFLYTGGTTGMPKGVMWEQDTLCRLGSRAHPLPLEPNPSIEEYRASIAARPAPIGLPAAPLMHGTGHVTTLNQLLGGGTIVTMPNRSLDAEALLDTCERRQVSGLAIVGDAFARPIADALEANPGRWSFAPLFVMVSSGVMWSQPVKERLLAQIPQLIIMDALGSSEALGMGSSTSSNAGVTSTAKFDLGANGVVVLDNGDLVQPGSGDIGRLGVAGLMPVGYYKDEVKTAATFPTIAGRRYSLPGDFATVEADGTITLLGRGSVCINTGGRRCFRRRSKRP